jgi:hypothetical protein
MPGYLAGSLPQ